MQLLFAEGMKPLGRQARRLYASELATRKQSSPCGWLQRPIAKLLLAPNLGARAKAHLKKLFYLDITVTHRTIMIIQSLSRPQNLLRPASKAAVNPPPLEATNQTRTSLTQLPCFRDASRSCPHRRPDTDVSIPSRH